MLNSNWQIVAAVICVCFQFSFNLFKIISTGLMPRSKRLKLFLKRKLFMFWPMAKWKFFIVDTFQVIPAWKMRVSLLMKRRKKKMEKIFRISGTLNCLHLLRCWFPIYGISFFCHGLYVTWFCNDFTTISHTIISVALLLGSVAI